VGASHARLTANHATGNAPTGPTPFSGGVIVISGKCFGGADPTYDQVDHTIVGGNVPADIEYDGTGHHNTFSQNGAPVTMVTPLDCGGGG
jgi:hypothetical protein